MGERAESTVAGMYAKGQVGLGTHDPMAVVPLCDHGYRQPLSVVGLARYLEVRGGGRYLSDWRSPTAPATHHSLDDDIEEGNGTCKDGALGQVPSVGGFFFALFPFPFPGTFMCV